MKKMLPGLAGLVALFVAGFLAARTLSRPPPLPDRPEGASTKTSRAQNPLPRRTGHGQSGGSFASALRAQERVEAALGRGDFQNILETPGYGEWVADAAYAWAATDPEGLWQWLEDGGKSRVHVWRIYDAVFKNWFKQDPDAALDALRKTGRYDRADAKWAILGMLFGDDPEVTRAVGERLDEFIGKIEVDPRHSVGDLLSGEREVVEKMRGLPESRAKEDLVRHAVAGWFRMDWRAAREWAAALPAAERVEMEHALFGMGIPRNIQKDPEGMAWIADWLGHEENRPLRVKLGKQVVSTMATDDPEAAMDWATANLGGAALGNAIGAVVSRQLSNDRNASFEMVDSLPPGGLRQQAGIALIRALRKTDASAAYQRAVAEQEGGLVIGPQEWTQIAISLARKPDDALRILSDLPENVPAILEERTIDYLASWHPEETLVWAARLGDERGAKISERVLHTWKSANPKAAEEWENGARAGH